LSYSRSAAVVSVRGVYTRTKEFGLSVAPLNTVVVVFLTEIGAAGVDGVAVRVEVREKGA